MELLTEEHLCVGRWLSKVNGRDNGLISILVPPNPQTGSFAGLHYVPDDTGRLKEIRPILGTCQHPGAGGGGVHFMEFQETTENLETFEYSGVIVPDSSSARQHRIPNGKRKRLSIELSNGRVEVTADDEWTGVKTT